MRHAIVASLILMLLLPAAAGAQSLDGSLGNTNPFTISVTPQYPVPFGQATISLLSSTIDLTNAAMTLSVGGKRIYQGNVQPVSVPLGKTGSVTSVTIQVTSGDVPYTESVVIQPQDVSLIAEPVASAPALYPGKPLIPLEGSVRVVALANLKDVSGKTIDPATLSYSWSVDGTQIASGSGIGKQALMVASPLQYRQRSVSVAVQNQAGGLVGGAALSFMASDPIVRIYESDPLLGIRFDRALSGAYAITGTESTLYAAPFSLPLAGGAPLLRWFLNGASAQTGNTITLRPTGAGDGSASLSFIASAGTATQAATSFSISFGTQKSSNFFGL